MKKTRIPEFAALLLLVSLFYVGCRANGYVTCTNTPTPSATEMPTGTPTDTPLPTATSTPSPTPVVYLDTLGIKGFTYDGSESDSLTHLCRVEYQAEYEGKTYTDLQIAAGGQGKIAVLCSYSDTPEDGMYVYEENRDYCLLFLSYENGRLILNKRIDIGKSQYCWLTQKSDRIMISRAVADENEVTHQSVMFYDYEGQELTNASLSDDLTAGSFYLSGHSDCYYEGDYTTHTIRKVNLATGEKTEISYDETLYLKSIYGVSTIDGADYICANFMGGDFRTYEGIINAETGEMLYLADDSEVSYISCEGDKLTINGRYTEGYGNDSTIFDGTELISYHQNVEYNYTYNLLGDMLVVLYTTYDTHDEVYDVGEGETYTYSVTDKTNTDMALVDVSTRKIIESNRIVTNDNMFLSQISYVDTDQVLTVSSDQAGALEIYVWALDGAQHTDFGFDDIADIKVEPFTGFTLAEVDGAYTRSDFIPGECSADLAEARAYANQMEEKYGIEIYIGDEVKCLMGGYLFKATDDKELLMSCLTTMDAEFAKYPTGFFSLYKKMENYPNGLEIYFTGDLIGYEDGNLSQAGGLRTEDNGAIIIALDCDDGRYEAAVHHEISHSIENLIEELGDEKLNEDYWNSINVKYGGDRTYYANSYQYQDAEYYYGFRANYKYTYASWDWADGDKSQVLFIDDYAMTYPTEDRSRMFEYVMWDDFDLSEYPALYEKFEYYSELIKKMLIKNGIDPTAECYWEWVFKDKKQEAGN